jgi:transglutaminase-like putative cysteine protease
MLIKNLLIVLLLFRSLIALPQENLYSSLTIPDNLKKNANAVLRVDETQIEMASLKSLKHHYRRVVTILNKEGNDFLDAYVHYDDNINVKTLRATVYDAFGLEINKFKKSDFKDVAAVNDFSLYEDSRVKYLEYTPINYPYTIEFVFETETENTAWIPSWRPLEGYYISTENSSYKISYDASIGIKTKEKRFSDVNIVNESTDGILSFKAVNIEALKPEEYSPKIREFAPSLLVSPINFHYENYIGSINDWNNLGKWINDNLLVGRASVSEETKSLINKLVEGVDNPLERAKIVYKFVQDNTRYISVQVGIGGIQPFSAYEVDKVKYGDCKGLTNYTKALLSIVGVESYYTEVYATQDGSQIGLEEDFASLLGQANHVILNIPKGNDEDIWLECTSQKTPFGFIGDFTDDRDVFVITPEGGKIKHTKKYTTNENLQITKGLYSILNDGSIDLEGVIVSKGIQYDNKYSIETQAERDLDLYYKKRWNYINNLVFSKKEILNDKDSIQFKETIKFTATNYSKIVGDRILFNINAINRNTEVPDRYRERKFPLKIYRGFKDVDEFEISLPQDFKIESLPQNTKIENKFGYYSFDITVKNNNIIRYNRQFVVKDGEFPKEDYEEFRNFYKEVSKFDNIKIALIKKL